MENILINDEMDESRYIFKNPYLDDDIGEWTAEEFYRIPTNEDYFMEAGALATKFGTWVTKHPNNPISKLVVDFLLSRRAFAGTLWDGTELESIGSPTIKAYKVELKRNLDAIKFFPKMHVRLGIINGIILISALTKYIIHEVKYKSAFGRFPADMCKFYVYLTELPEELTESDVKKLKIELKNIRKDTKWLTGRHGTKITTPKERKLLDLIDEQVQDLLSIGMIDKRGENFTENRIRDRLEQLVQTSNEFFEMIHADMSKEAKAETVKEYMI